MSNSKLLKAIANDYDVCTILVVTGSKIQSDSTLKALT